MKKSTCIAMAAIGLASTANADLLATTFVKIGDQSTIDGSITAGTNVTLGGMETIGKEVKACQQISILDQSKLATVFSASITPATGTWASHQISSTRPWAAPGSCAAPVQPNLSFAPGTASTTVALRTRAFLAAAARGAVTVLDGGILQLGAGVHQFASLTLGQNVTLQLDDGASLLVKGNVTIGNYVVIGGAGSDKAALQVGGNLNVGTNASFPMNVVALGNIVFADHPSVKDMQGYSITLGVGSLVHNGTINPTTLVTKLSDDFNIPAMHSEGSRSQAVTQTALVNWDITAGTVDVFGNMDASFIPVPLSQGRVVDLEGSSTDDQAGMGSTMTTKATFAPGTYSINFSLAGCLRDNNVMAANNQPTVQQGDYTAIVSFGGKSWSYTMPWDKQFTPITIPPVTIVAPSKFSIQGVPQAGHKYANLLLDDVYIYQIPATP